MGAVLAEIIVGGKQRLGAADRRRLTRGFGSARATRQPRWQASFRCAFRGQDPSSRPWLRACFAPTRGTAHYRAKYRLLPRFARVRRRAAREAGSDSVSNTPSGAPLGELGARVTPASLAAGAGLVGSGSKAGRSLTVLPAGRNRPLRRSSLRVRAGAAGPTGSNARSRPVAGGSAREPVVEAAGAAPEAKQPGLRRLSGGGWRRAVPPLSDLGGLGDRGFGLSFRYVTAVRSGVGTAAPRGALDDRGISCVGLGEQAGLTQTERGPKFEHGFARGVAGRKTEFGPRPLAIRHAQVPQELQHGRGHVE